jgi:hypothetical protein
LDHLVRERVPVDVVGDEGQPDGHVLVGLHVAGTGTGASLTGRTVSVTVAGSDGCAASATRKTKASAPWKSGSGAKVRSGAVPESTPCAGGLTIS